MSNPFERYKKKFKPGDYVFKDGDVGTEMYIVQSGRIELVKSVHGREEAIAVLDKGDFFGEMAVLEGMPRNMSARALADSELTAINGTVFDQMIKKNIEIAVRMLRKFSTRLREADAENLRLRELSRGLDEELSSRPPAAEAEAAVVAPPAPAPAPAPTKKSAAAPPPTAAVKAPPATKPVTPPPPPPVAATVKAAPPRPPGVLVVKGGEKRHPLPSDEVTIGRADPVTGLRPDIDLSTEDINRFISRRHAKILYKDGTYFLVEEVGVTNGTYLNGKRLQAGVYTPIQFGDELCFGKVFLMLERAK